MVKGSGGFGDGEGRWRVGENMRTSCSHISAHFSRSLTIWNIFFFHAMIHAKKPHQDPSLHLVEQTAR